MGWTRKWRKRRECIRRSNVRQKKGTRGRREGDMAENERMRRRRKRE